LQAKKQNIPKKDEQIMSVILWILPGESHITGKIRKKRKTFPNLGLFLSNRI